jgi:Asp-tRNA(Asn)/Glu-tRNA(Gln) amidotransferase A subunit family amidase
VIASARTIAADVAAGRISAVAVAERSLGRCETVHAALNAFTEIDRQGALARAAVVDRIVAGGGDPGPLAGVPVAVKDLIDHAGHVTTCGSSFYRETPAVSATVVARLEAAGAVIVGRTGLHEFAFGFSSENHWFGPVRNPWDPATSPGGSSGGAGAAVAAGAVPIAVGTDTGGSVRVPAALCGTVGLKVTHGRVPLGGVFPLAPSIDTVGPLARTIADAALAYGVMAGDDPEDPWSAPRPVEEPGDPRRLDGLRIGIPRPWLDRPVDLPILAAFDGFAARAEAAGAAIVDLTDPVLAPPGEIEASAYFEVAGVHRSWYTAHPERYGPDVGRRLARVFEITADDFLRALRWRAALRHAWERAFTAVDVVATPTVATMRKLIGEEQVTVAGTAMSYRGPLSCFTALVNHAGLPALAVPLAAPGDPPPGLQLVGPAWSEADLLRLGSALDDAGITGLRSPPEWDRETP